MDLLGVQEVHPLYLARWSEAGGVGLAGRWDGWCGLDLTVVRVFFSFLDKSEHRWGRGRTRKNTK